MARTDEEIRAELDRRISEYRLIRRSTRGYDEEADNEQRIEADACIAELGSIRDFIFGGR